MIGSNISDEELLTNLRVQVGDARMLLLTQLRYLVEVYRRGLHLRKACGSLVEFCIRELDFSRDEASLRFHAVRAAAAYPVVLDMLGRGETHLSALRILRPHLTADNHMTLLNEARGLSKRQLRKLVQRQTRGTPETSPEPVQVWRRAGDGANEAIQLNRHLPTAEPHNDPSDEVLVEGLSHGDKGAPFIRQTIPPTPSRDNIPTPSDRELIPPTHPGDDGPQPPTTQPDITLNIGAQWAVPLSVDALEKLKRLTTHLGCSSPAEALRSILDRALTLALDELEAPRLRRPTKKRSGGEDTFMPTNPPTSAGVKLAKGNVRRRKMNDVPPGGGPSKFMAEPVQAPLPRRRHPTTDRVAADRVAAATTALVRLGFTRRDASRAAKTVSARCREGLPTMGIFLADAVSLLSPSRATPKRARRSKVWSRPVTAQALA